MNDQKPKLMTEDLILNLEHKGITLDLCSKKQAKDILERRTYYYKLASYRKMFNRDSNTNKYINLDFEYLNDLASIDTYIKQYLLSLAIDIEHSAKTALMTDITYNSKEDGYHLINNFKNQSNVHSKMYLTSISQFKRNNYLKDMSTKRKNISVWVFLEIINFGVLTRLIELYCKIYSIRGSDKLGKLSKLLKYVKNIRNTCAHNNVFIINTRHRKSRIQFPTAESKTMCDRIGVGQDYAFYNKTHDMLILFELHKLLCSEALNKRRYEEGISVLNRIERNINYYNGNKKILNLFDFLALLIAFLS